VRIIFLTYVNRSGSTFLANTLSKSKKIIVFPEAEILVNLLLIKPELHFSYSRIFLNQILSDAKFSCWELNWNELSGLHNIDTNFDAFIEILKIYRNKISPGADLFVFKAERLIYLFSKIKAEFRKSHNLLLIALVRDPRAIYESQKRTMYSNTGLQMSRNPVITTITWNNFTKNVINLTKCANVLVVSYEKMIKNYRETMQDVFHEIGTEIPYFSKKGNLLERMPENQREKHKLADKIPKASNLNIWKTKLKRKEIYLIEKYARKNMSDFKYMATVNQPKIFTLSDIKGYIYWVSYYFRLILKKVKAKING